MSSLPTAGGGCLRSRYGTEGMLNPKVPSERHDWLPSLFQLLQCRFLAVHSWYVPVWNFHGFNWRRSILQINLKQSWDIIFFLTCKRQYWAVKIIIYYGRNIWWFFGENGMVPHLWCYDAHSFSIIQYLCISPRKLDFILFLYELVLHCSGYEPLHPDLLDGDSYDFYRDSHIHHHIGWDHARMIPILRLWNAVQRDG